MFRQAASRASALARQSAAGGQRRQMAEAVAADKLHFNFFLPGGTIQKDAAVVCFHCHARSAGVWRVPCAVEWQWARRVWRRRNVAA